jgi:hypothetical protein
LSEKMPSKGYKWHKTRFRNPDCRQNELPCLRKSTQLCGSLVMEAILPSRNLSISINRNAQDVYNFVSVPENLPRWASGLGKSLKLINGDWIAEGPEGPVKVMFTERNVFGVLDHWVSPKPGMQIYIPMRVIPNGNISELVFTLFRLTGMSEEKFAADADWVMRDLISLKNLMESP